jgi:hypothetical protein
VEVTASSGGDGNGVISTASDNRRIEQVVGNATVSVTGISTDTYVGALARTTNVNYEIYVTRTTELDAILPDIYNGTGAAGDNATSIAIGNGYWYVCVANWESPGTADIWTRTLLTTGAW